MLEDGGSAEDVCAGDLRDGAGRRDTGGVACSQGCLWGLGFGLLDEKGWTV